MASPRRLRTETVHAMRAAMTGIPSKEGEAEERLRLQIEAYHSAALAYAAVKLGLPEAMGSDAWSAAELAAKLGLSAPHLERLLRALLTIGVCAERAEERFSLATLGQSLTAGSPSRLREKVPIVVEHYWRPWVALPHTLRTGEAAFPEVFGLTASEWRRQNPEAGDLFETYLAKETFAAAGPIVSALELSGVHSVAEIGGYGGLLAALLNAHPTVQGILFGWPETVAAAEKFLAGVGVAERVRRVDGDPLVAISIEADLYLLNGVLRTVDDAGALGLLRNCRKAMPSSARLVMIERLFPASAAEDPAAIMLDLHMMTITGGSVRTCAEIEALLVQAGFSVASVRSASGISIIEAVASPLF